jgi:hypothetical protein
VDTAPVYDQKLWATLCHRTQHALFVRHSSEEAGRSLTVPEVVVTLESLHRVLPPVYSAAELRDDPLFAALLLAGASMRI